jgi:uncharacterized membrane protein YfcA
VRTGGGLVAATFVIGVYGGYFGAAAGVLFLALLLAATHDTLPRSNALKNAVLGIANATAAIGFCVFGDVRWAAVLPLAAGLFAGARIGPIVVRRTDGTALRRIIGLAAIGLAIKLALDAY